MPDSNEKKCGSVASALQGQPINGFGFSILQTHLIWYLQRADRVLDLPAGEPIQEPGVASDATAVHTSWHDTQKCSIGGADWNDSHDRFFAMDLRLHLSQCAAGRGSCGDAVLIVCLCVRIIQRGRVLLRVPQNAVVVIGLTADSPPAIWK